MTHNCLKLNQDKTEWLIFNGGAISRNVTLTVGEHTVVNMCLEFPVVVSFVDRFGWLFSSVHCFYVSDQINLSG